MRCFVFLWIGSLIQTTFAIDIIVERNKAREMLDDELQLVLDLHNNFRKQAGAKDMEHMYYHRGLEQQAKDWLEQCKFKHGFGDVSKYNLPWSSQGQNLWMSTGPYRQSGDFDLTGAITAWHDEIVDYDINSGTCQPKRVCGHYTQIVWATTNYVGCAYKYCDQMATGGTNRHIVACNYGPAGNWMGQKPYIQGAPGEECTECHSMSSECDDGLCRQCSVDGGGCECKAKCYNCGIAPSSGSKCQCQCANGWYGPSCQKVCENRHGNCWNGWYPAQCTDMASVWDSVRRECLVMCGKCNKTNPVPAGQCAPRTSSYPISGPPPKSYGSGVRIDPSGTIKIMALLQLFILCQDMN